MYVLDVVSAIQKMTVNELIFNELHYENLSGKPNIKELDLLKKLLVFNETFKKKNLVWLTTKLIGQKLDPINAKEYYNFYLTRKTKIGRKTKSNFGTTKNL